MNTQIDHKFFQTAKVQSLDETKAILQFEDGQTITWPRTLLPQAIKKDQLVRVLVHDQATEEDERKRLAKALLNEVMHS